MILLLIAVQINELYNNLKEAVHTNIYKMAGTSREMRKLPSEIMFIVLQKNHTFLVRFFFSTCEHLFHSLYA